MTDRQWMSTMFVTWIAVTWDGCFQWNIDRDNQRCTSSNQWEQTWTSTQRNWSLPCAIMWFLCLWHCHAQVLSPARHTRNEFFCLCQSEFTAKTATCCCNVIMIIQKWNDTQAACVRFNAPAWISSPPSSSNFKTKSCEIEKKNCFKKFLKCMKRLKGENLETCQQRFIFHHFHLMDFVDILAVNQKCILLFVCIEIPLTNAAGCNPNLLASLSFFRATGLAAKASNAIKIEETCSHLDGNLCMLHAPILLCDKSNSF